MLTDLQAVLVCTLLCGVRESSLGLRRHLLSLGMLLSRCTKFHSYLLACGMSRHRACVVGMGSVRCSLGSHGRLLAGLLEAASKPLGGRLRASWDLFGPLGGLFGASWRPLGGLLEAASKPLGGRFGASFGPLGALLRLSRGGRLEVSVRGPPLGPLLGPSWGSLGMSWTPLGPF